MIWPIEASILTNDGKIVASATPSSKHNTNMKKLQHGPQNPSGDFENITPHSGLAARKFYMTTTPSLRRIIPTNSYNITTPTKLTSSSPTNIYSKDLSMMATSKKSLLRLITRALQLAKEQNLTHKQ